LAWISNTIQRPVAKKAAAIAMVNAMGNIGSIPGSYIWPAAWGPFYTKSFGAEIAILGFACVAGLALRFYLILLNKRLDRQEEEQHASAVGPEAKENTWIDSEQRLGAKSFRYLY
jgi:hypothetical protein